MAQARHQTIASPIMNCIEGIVPGVSAREHIQVPGTWVYSERGGGGGAYVRDGGNGHHPRLPENDILERGDFLAPVVGSGRREEAFHRSCGPAVGA